MIWFCVVQLQTKLVICDMCILSCIRWAAPTSLVFPNSIPTPQDCTLLLGYCGTISWIPKPGLEDSLWLILIYVKRIIPPIGLVMPLEKLWSVYSNEHFIHLGPLLILLVLLLVVLVVVVMVALLSAVPECGDDVTNNVAYV